MRKRGRGRKRNGPRRAARLNTDRDGVAGEETQMNCWEKRKEGGERAGANDGEGSSLYQIGWKEERKDQWMRRRRAHIW